jgi:alkaline phosphatase D
MCDWVTRGGKLLQTWDDHDRGENDCGKHYQMAQQSREIFMDFWRVPAASPRRMRPDGVFTSELFGPVRRQLQVITLDTRSFRDDLTATATADPGCGWVPGPGNDQCSLSCLSSNGRYNALSGPCKNDYVPNEQPVGEGGPTMLGAEQWAWLEEQLSVVGPKLRIIASSVQVRKRISFVPFYTENHHHLPRQARDKHRESTQKRFSCSLALSTMVGRAGRTCRESKSE